jgi:hypothetical protein
VRHELEINGSFSRRRHWMESVSIERQLVDPIVMQPAQYVAVPPKRLVKDPVPGNSE